MGQSPRCTLRPRPDYCRYGIKFLMIIFILFLLYCGLGIIYRVRVLPHAHSLALSQRGGECASACRTGIAAQLPRRQVRRLGIPPGLEALPHLEMWKDLPFLVKALAPLAPSFALPPVAPFAQLHFPSLPSRTA